MKNETRKLINGLIAAALMTSIFTGCSKQETESIPFSSTSLVSEVSSPAGETQLYRDETLDMRYKHWYDNPEVTHSTEVKYDDIWQIRDPKTGQLQLDNVENDIAVISEDLVPSSNYEDYAKVTALASFAADTDYRVFLNNVDTGDTFGVSDVVMPISGWLETQHIAHFSSSESVPTLYIATAAGQDAITFETIDDPDDDFDGGWLIKYVDGEFEQAAAASEIVISSDTLNLTPWGVETILGLKILVNDEHKVINIVTDNKDLVVDQPAAPTTSGDEPTSDPTTSGNDEPTTSTDEPTTSESTTSGNDEPTSQPTKPTTSEPTSSSKPTTPTKPTQPTQPTKPTQPSSGPKDGDTKVENGVTYRYNAAIGRWGIVTGEPNRGTQGAGTGPNGNQVGIM